MDLLTKTIKQATKIRVKKLESYSTNSESIQWRELRQILTRCKKTEYLKRYPLTDRGGYGAFKSHVPVVEYEGIAPYIERVLAGEANILSPYPIRWMAKSSGTSNNRSKFIPVPRVYLKKNHYKGGSDVVWNYLDKYPNSSFFSHKGFILGGSHSIVDLSSQVRAGDLSAILVENMPRLGEAFRVPSKEVILMSDWEKKLERLIPLIAKADVGNISGVPSWMLMVLKHLMEYAGVSNLRELWPNLEVFFHGGISFAPYREEYKRIISGEMNYMETYNASEGFFALQDDPSNPGMLLLLDHGIFYEFWPMDAYHEGDTSKIVPLVGVQKGVNYAMVITTLGGLYRYILGDVVEFTDILPYRIRIVGRTKLYINAFGEELMVHNADTALANTAKQFGGVEVSEYTAGPVVLPDEGSGYHHWVIEFNTPPEDAEQFADVLDQELRNLNSDYDAKRYKDLTLTRLKLDVVPQGTFKRWMASRNKLGGQHKVPRLANNLDYIESILKLQEE